MVKTKTKTIRRTKKAYAAAGRSNTVAETEGVYILKLAVILILGAFWLRISFDASQLPLPVGAIIGLIFIRYEKLGVDRKIEYAILLLSMFVGFWLPLGIELVL